MLGRFPAAALGDCDGAYALIKQAGRKAVTASVIGQIFDPRPPDSAIPLRPAIPARLKSEYRSDAITRDVARAATNSLGKCARRSSSPLLVAQIKTLRDQNQHLTIARQGTERYARRLDT